jgi:UDP-glucuronate 4-epimerase
MARFSSRAYSLPMTIARLNTVVGPHKAFYGKQLLAVLEGHEIVLPGDPNPHSPIHSEDMIAQIEPLIDAASREPLTLNWGGDEVVTSQQTIARIAARTGLPAQICIRSTPGLAGGNITDLAKRRAITGPCKIGFWDGFEHMLDEMLDGAPLTVAQRSWDYDRPIQNVIFRGS